MTDTELRGLLSDCLKLWGVRARLVHSAGGWTVEAEAGAFSIARADPALRPARWFLQTPERLAAGRPPRAAPSIGAALSALRNTLGVKPGDGLRIGG